MVKAVESKEAAFRPLYDNVLIEPIAESALTQAGLVLPENSLPRPNRGKVIATGQGPLLSSGQCGPMPVEVGDTVIFAPGAAATFQVDGKEYTIIAVGRIIGVLNA